MVGYLQKSKFSHGGATQLNLNCRVLKVEIKKNANMSAFKKFTKKKENKNLAIKSKTNRQIRLQQQQ